MSERIQCDAHGVAEATIVCVHICETLKDGRARGFLWSFDEEEGDYQAVCTACRAMPQTEWERQAVSLGRVLCLECFRHAAALNEVEIVR